VGAGMTPATYPRRFARHSQIGCIQCDIFCFLYILLLTLHK
jgi:hypothetical protein